MRLQRVLEILRRDVLPAGGDEDVLQPVGDREEAVLVEVADVAGAQPAVVRQDFARRLLVLEVPAEDGVALDQHLTVVCNAKLDARQSRADGCRSGSCVGRLIVAPVVHSVRP